MTAMRRHKRWLLCIEHESPTGWQSSGTEFALAKKPIVSDGLAATAYVIWVGDWMKCVEGRRKYRTALYRVKWSGRKKLIWSSPIPPGGWGTQPYAPVDWPTGRKLVW